MSKQADILRSRTRPAIQAYLASPVLAGNGSPYQLKLPLAKSLEPCALRPCVLQHARRGEAGFTLIEIMAAMTVFFMVIGILVSSVSQAIRLAEFSQSSATESRDAAIRLAWFRETVGLVVMPAYSSDLQPQTQTQFEPRSNFVGKARSLSGLTLQSLNTESAGPGAFSWSLAFNPQVNETQLQYQAVKSRQFRLEAQVSDDSKTYTAFSWQGSSGRFLYLDETGTWRDQWPAENFGLTTPITTPPVAVGLEYGNDLRMLVVAIQNRSLPLPSLKELLK